MAIPHPSERFFNKLTDDRDAGRSLGTYDFPRDLRLSPVPSSAKGNSYVYKLPKTGDLFKPFLLGEVAAVERLVGETEEGFQTGLHRIHLKMLEGATKAARAYFSNDAVVLTDVIQQELKKNTVISHIWVVGDYEEAVIFVDCSEHTKIIRGPPVVGERVMVDVTLHRRDVYQNEVICKAYALAAHTVEVLSRVHLSSVGIMPQLDTAQVPSSIPDPAIDSITESLQTTSIE